MRKEILLMIISFVIASILLVVFIDNIRLGKIIIAIEILFINLIGILGVRKMIKSNDNS
ncbi:hypothetical protein ACFO6R_06020 [Eubacterium multiforme]|uniref:Competence protein ComGC n=1 Tax=Eubacterium multiforme TaxID=83339 RepID=A0ABT9US60_9FIRM|nr:hypothetical protein [Eubacterium multiforme]MDQ0149141.1 competence protein ComGC [Eubacterium multiforme]